MYTGILYTVNRCVLYASILVLRGKNYGYIKLTRFTERMIPQTRAPLAEPFESNRSRAFIDRFSIFGQGQIGRRLSYCFLLCLLRTFSCFLLFRLFVNTRSPFLEERTKDSLT